jgi:predicted O-linked N-acetylglucosamine transferase (SPINDLY family)
MKNNKGIIGKSSEQIIRDIIEKNPTYDAYLKLGDLLMNTGNNLEAINCYRNALMLKPKSALIYRKLGDAHIMLSNVIANIAIEFYRRSLEIDHNNAITYNKLGLAQYQMGEQDEARDSFRKALEIKKGFLRARFNLSIAQIPILYQKEEDVILSRQCYRQELEALGKSITLDRENVVEEAAKADLHPFYLAYQGYNDCELQSTYGELMSRVLRARYPQFNPAPILTPIKPGKSIRVGFVSSHFHDHVDWNVIIKGWIENLNNERYRLFGYSTGIWKDGQTEVARRRFFRFVEDIYSVEKLGRIIRDDRLNVLIYPEVGMNILTAKLAALRLAPIQCTSWGHPSTSGLPTIDYFLSSELAEPADAELHYTERLVRLPNLSIYYTPPDICEITGDRASFGLPAEGVLFLCAQNLFKYLPRYDDVFPRIAKGLGKCRFVFKKHWQAPLITNQFMRRLSQVFARYGLKSEDYVTLLPRMDLKRYYALCRVADIFLDSIGYSGFVTVLDAILFDLPIITIPGNLMRGRQSLAILTMMGVTNTIGSTVDDYVSLAVRLGLNADWRHQVRKKMAENKNRVYRDMNCIKGLEAFIEEAVLKSPIPGRS